VLIANTPAVLPHQKKNAIESFKEKILYQQRHVKLKHT
jgi:hypothetical protein